MAFTIIKFPSSITVDDLPFWARDWRMWADKSVGNVHRPTEVQALRNIANDAATYNKQGFRCVLTKFERELLNMELQIKRDMPHMQKSYEVAGVIAKRINEPVFLVKEWLEQISYIQRNYAIMEAQETRNRPIFVEPRKIA